MKTLTLFLILSLMGLFLFGQEDITSLSEKELDKLYNGKVITKKRRTDQNIIVIAQGIVVGSSRTIFDVIMNCDNHGEFVPNFKACESYYEGPDSIYGKTVVDPPMTKKDIDFYMFTKFKYSENFSKISWKLDTSQTHPKYITDTFGFWEIQELDTDTHLLSFYSNSDFKFHWSVNWFLEPIFKAAMKSSLPNLIKNVRARVESEENWVIGEKRPDPNIMTKQK